MPVEKTGSVDAWRFWAIRTGTNEWTSRRERYDRECVSRWAPAYVWWAHEGMMTTWERRVYCLSVCLGQHCVVRCVMLIMAWHGDTSYSPHRAAAAPAGTRLSTVHVLCSHEHHQYRHHHRHYHRSSAVDSAKPSDRPITFLCEHDEDDDKAC